MHNQQIPADSQRQNTNSPNHQKTNYLKRLGLIASISSLGTAATLHQPAQATTTVLDQNVIAELPSLDTAPNAVTSENQPASEIRNSDQNLDSYIPTLPTILIQSNLDQNSYTQQIPQLPTLEVAQREQKETPKKIYTVKAGDTITKIALKHGVSSSQIIEANQLTNPHFIKVNHQLVIPGVEIAQQPNYQSIQVSQVSSEREFSVNNHWENSQATTPKSLSSLTESKTESSQKKEAEASLINYSSETANTKEATDTDIYISKLRQDIIELRTKYQQQSGNNEITFVKPTILNQESTTNTPVPNAVVEEANETETNTSLQEQSQEQSIASAPTPAVNYNSLLVLPKNQGFVPALPPLASPEEYLPDNPIFDGYMWPAKGALTSGYGWRGGRMHQGIDIAAPIGTPIMAAASGEVIFAGWNSGGYGNLVQLKHPDGSITFYAHNNRLLVSNGQKVKQGELIAEMGSTGRSTGPHLHFEIRPNGTTAINPIARLPKERLN
jgi:murein DD-endopeptidase MepM/ murein hydrolase activator NlpD